MKTILIFLISFLLLSCNARKIEIAAKEKQIQEILGRKEVIVNYPINWTYKLDHNGISYFPKDLKNEFYKCRVNIFKYDGSIIELCPINEGIKTEDELKKSGMPKTVQTRFGKTDIYKVTDITEYMTRNHEVITLVFHFSHKETFYVLRYRVFKEFFDTYKNELDYFIENLAFKNEVVSP